MDAETEKVQYEIWIKTPDGEEGLAYFLNSPERYDDEEKARLYTERYNEGDTKGRSYFVVKATSTTKREKV